MSNPIGSTASDADHLEDTMSAVAIVTGAAQGIGLAIARRLCEQGHRVVLADLQAARTQAAAEELAGLGHLTRAFAADLTVPAQCAALVAHAVAQLGRLDVLVNNAGDYTKASIDDLTEEAWQRMFDVNLKSTMLMMREGARVMAATGGGRIVNIASVDAYKAMPTLAHYAAAKAGVVSLTRSFAAHYGPQGVLINAVAPGPVATERAKQEGWLAKYIPDTPLRRSAEPGDIAEVVAFLASPANRCVTGETVIASCGLVMA
jgi:3-oxoacyl-[acyl-carrier protein] reductase